MIRNGVEIEDSLAEAFGMTATRVLITAIDATWARIAATATSAKDLEKQLLNRAGQCILIGIEAVCELGENAGVSRITAGNYGGKLGQFHYHLRESIA